MVLRSIRESRPKAENQVGVLVAKQRIGAWMLMREPEKLFIVKDFPQHLVPPKALKLFEEVQG
jgi:hypothetical protein